MTLITSIPSSEPCHHTIHGQTTFFQLSLIPTKEPNSRSSVWESVVHRMYIGLYTIVPFLSRMSGIVPSSEPSEVLHPVVEDVPEMSLEFGNTYEIGEYGIQGE